MNTPLNLCRIGAVLVVATSGWAQPTLTRQPTNVSVSLGATALFRVTATSTNPPVTYRWRHEDDEIGWATNASLTLTNVQLADAGSYTVAVTDADGTTNSDAAVLDVDPTFTKITTGEIVTDKRHWHGQAWGDYDNDGDPDLFIQTLEGSWNPIYRNNGDGTFTRVLVPSLQGQHNNDSWWFQWVDYDNDGHLDLSMPNWSAYYGSSGNSRLLRSNGDGTFTRITTNAVVRDGTISLAGAWGDYDRDGDLDLFVANEYVSSQTQTNWFYQNQGDGSFLKLACALTGDLGKFGYPTWVDVDEDGWSDLFVTAAGTNALYRNTGDGAFLKVTGEPLVSDRGNWGGAAWADYDNDGDLDVFVPWLGFPSGTGLVALYRNDGAFHFTKMTTNEVGSLAAERVNSWACAWGDYDNDGSIDLIAANGWQQSDRSRCLFYRNNGDGTFNRVTAGSPANDAGAVIAVNWVDYDQDGLLDLFCTVHDESTLVPNLLYRNNGNSNAWLEVRCVGTSSPRWGTGAKVRVQATIGGKPKWQTRLIDAGGSPWGGQSFVAHFGLGDAAVVDTLRIEWPSGIVQELHQVAPRQILTMTEPAKLEVRGIGQFRICSWLRMAFEVQRSTDLLDWQPVATVTNLVSPLEFTDPDAPQHTARFYRAVMK
jgi:hypothetical protein